MDVSDGTEGLCYLFLGLNTQVKPNSVPSCHFGARRKPIEGVSFVDSKNPGSCSAKR